MPVGLQLALAVLGIVLLAGTAWVAGRLVLASTPETGGLLGHSLAIAVGLALLAQAGLALALVGWLRPWVLGVAVAALHWAGRGEWRALAAAARTGTRPPLALAAATLGVVAATVTLALYPPTGFDETLYHLPMARAFAETGALPFLPDLRFPAFPALAEVLFAELFLWGGELSSHAVSVVATLATAGLVLGWGCSFRRRTVGWLAAALYCGSPLVIYLAGSGYVEPVLALFAMGALHAAARFRQDGSPVWRNVAALLAGSAAGTKYLGLLVLVFVAIDVVLASRARGGSDALVRDGGVRGRVSIGQRWRHAAIFAGIAAAAAGPTYVRIWVLAGSPLFPFFPELFGSTAWDADWFLGSRGAARSREALTAIWDAAFRRDRLGYLPPILPALPFLVPVVVWSWVAARRLEGARCALFVLVFLASSPMHGHYFAMVLPALALVCADALDALVERLLPAASSSALAAAALALSLLGIAYSASWLWRFGPPPSSLAGRDRYLEARLQLYASVRWLDERAGGATVYGLYAENCRYYFRGRWLGDYNGPASYERVLQGRVASAGSGSSDFPSRLQRLGSEYLVISEANASRYEDLLSSPLLVLERADGRGRVYRVASAAPD